MRVSARNVIRGVIISMARGEVNAEVVLEPGGGPRITAIITNASLDLLGLSEGMQVSAVIKASSIILGKNVHDVEVSARNLLCGNISRIVDGPVHTEVCLELGGGNELCAVITRASSARLKLREGEHACALFKASSVILCVD